MLRSEIERLSGLEARVAALERELGLRIAAQPEARETPSPPVHLRWLSRNDVEAAQEDASLDPKREEILQYNLQQSPGKMIAIRSAAGDPIARQLAERFKAVFERSSWRVVGVDEVVVPTAQHGLALAGGALPTPPDLASAYIAFTAAGFDLVPRLDPSLEPNDAVLIVALAAVRRTQPWTLPAASGLRSEVLNPLRTNQPGVRNHEDSHGAPND